MSKKTVGLIISVILFFVFLITASAHSGRTDANGGHWNHATGEYHYHSGEYAGRKQSSNSQATLDALERLEREQEEKPKGKRASQDVLDIIENRNKHTVPHQESSEDNQETEKKKDTFWDVVGTILVWLLILSPFIAEIWSDIFPSRFTKRMRKIQKESDMQLKQEAIQRRKEEKERFLKKEEELRKEKALLKKEKQESFLNRYFFWRR